MRATKNKKLIILCMGVVLLALAGVLLFLPARNAQAQCTTPSSCKTCHEIQANDPISDKGIWHEQHALFDFCETCHGGDRTAETAALAHQGMHATYAEITPTCISCHPSELETCVRTYGDALGIGEDEIGSILDIAHSGSADAATLIEQMQTGTLTGPQQPAGWQDDSTPSTTVPAGNNPLNTILLVVLLVCLVAGTGYVIWNERRLKVGQKENLAVLSRLASFIRQENWSPYAAGLLLGITGILSVLIGHHLLSAAGPVASITSLLLHAVAPGAADANMYFRFVVPPEVNWSVMLFIGIFLGGMLGALTSGKLRLRWNDDPVWRKVFGKAAWKRIVIGFGGAILLQYGASIAGGCTSGLAISGGMLLAPSAFLFIAGMFISGIITALIVFRRKY